MNDTEREERNARRRRDPNRALDFVMLPLSTLRGMVEASPRQCQDCAGMFLYLAEHPQMGNFIPEAAGWGKDKCARTLRIHGRIAADCALFCRESGGVRCMAWPLEKVAQALEKRKTYSDNRKGKMGGGVQSIDSSIDAQSIEEEEEEEEKDTLSSQGASLHTPPYPPERPADGRMEAPADTAGRNLFKVGNRPASVLKRPKDAGEVEAHLSGIAVLKLTPAERQKAALLFFNEMESVGWIDPKGRPILDWKTSACNFAIRYGENAHKPFRAGRQEGGYSRNDKNANGKGVNNYDIR